ncbi:transcription factor SOX-10 [Striga asiatica]|uniref:Transcription factor SOX-10 n=1 Tax=Striga asiatica TaxID=4170 RepID=A0A5A7QGE0_STRAF|nr:transcription factor SOX-10 [Striga asiatica]
MAAVLGVVFALLINFTVGQNQQRIVGGNIGWTIRLGFPPNLSALSRRAPLTSPTLNSTGNQYYICIFGTHCAQGGQRLSPQQLHQRRRQPTGRQSAGGRASGHDAGRQFSGPSHRPVGAAAGDPWATGFRRRLAGSFFFVLVSAGVVLAV